MALITRLMPNRFYLDDVFDDFMFPTVKDSEFGKMKCDIYEKDNTYYLEMDIPGFDKKDISLEVKNGYLNVTAHRKSEEDVKEKNYIRKERSYGKFQRSFYVGDLDEDKIEASFNNGTLTVVIPKKEAETNKKYIEIK